MIAGFFRRILTLSFALLVGWWLYSYSLSHINSEDLLEDPTFRVFPQPVPTMLDADALVKQAEGMLASGEYKQAEVLGLAALNQNPSSGRAASFLLSLYEKNNQIAIASEVGDLAGKLWPAHGYTHSRLANYWANQRRIDKLLAEWNILLIRNPGLQGELFPKLQALTVDVGQLDLLEPYIKNPPSWWAGFFGYLSSRVSLSDLQTLYFARFSSNIPPQESERNSYVDRLIKEGSWKDAFDIWFLGLSQLNMRFGDLVFDGGFESALYNQGFAWYLSGSKNPRISREITYGIKGGKALHIVFRAQDRINFQHVSQRLLLKPGDYTLSFRYRLDTLKNTKGLVWRIHCIAGDNIELAESSAVNGKSPWSESSVDFAVPKSCASQLLRLEAASPYVHDHTFSGSIWFDDIKIRKRKLKDDK